MKFGVSFANILTFSQPEAAKAIGQAAEAAGFDSVWTVEHVLVPAGYRSTYPYDPSGRMPAPNDMDLPDPLIWLTWVAAHTSNIRLATGVLVLPQRNPAILAKEIATLDVLSGGRLLLGIGTGWLQEEFDALGVPFAGRGARTDSFIAAMRALWTGQETTYRDDHVAFDRAVSRPRPVAGSVPIHIGGHSEVAARRAGRLGDGFFPGDHKDIARLIKIVHEHAERAGRDPGAVEVTVTGEGLLGPDPQAEVERLTSLGVHRAVIPPLAFDPAGITEALAAFGDRVITPSS